jgi:hypothetical protein
MEQDTMSRGSALARVIGLTKSLSPLGHGGQVVPPNEGAEAVVEAAAAERSADAAPPSTEVTAELSVLAQVTVVTAEAAPAAGDPVREAVTEQAIGDIEADIAKLLATLDGAGAMPPTEATPLTDSIADLPDDDGDEAVAAADNDDSEDATLVLLSELDRLWRADPAVGNSYMR